MLNTDTLRKVARLAMWGATRGERESAQRILDKVGKTIEDILRDDIDEEILVQLKYKNTFERDILFQIYACINNTDIVHYRRYGTRRIGFITPRSTAQKIVSAAETMIPLWRSQIKSFHSAFIQANNLYSDKKSKEVKEVLTAEEIDEILAMAKNIKTASLNQLLEGDR
jgi:hypothetical protein